MFEPQTKVVQFWSCLDTITVSDLNKQIITVLEDHLGKVVKVCEETSVFGQEKWSKDVQPFGSTLFATHPTRLSSWAHLGHQKQF